MFVCSCCCCSCLNTHTHTQPTTITTTTAAAAATTVKNLVLRCSVVVVCRSPSALATRPSFFLHRFTRRRAVSRRSSLQRLLCGWLLRCWRRAGNCGHLGLATDLERHPLHHAARHSVFLACERFRDVSFPLFSSADRRRCLWAPC